MKNLFNKKNGIKILSMNAIYIAIYMSLMFIFMPISSGALQIRIAEIMVILPIFDKYSIISVTLACFISNIVCGNIIDAIFGAFATFVGLFFTYLLRKKNYFLATFPSIVSNMIIVPFILKFAYGIGTYPILLLMPMVAIGEIISIYIFGYIFYRFLYKNSHFFASL